MHKGILFFVLEILIKWNSYRKEQLMMLLFMMD